MRIAKDKAAVIGCFMLAAGYVSSLNGPIFLRGRGMNNFGRTLTEEQPKRVVLIRKLCVCGRANCSGSR